MSRTSASLGVLIPGQGALKTQFPLPPLTSQQYELVLKAKKYASEETARVIHSNKPLNITAISLPHLPDRTLQRHQAIQFMSRVYVGSISFEVREEMLKAAFSNYGLVKSVNMSWDTNTKTHKGFAFIEFEYPEGAGLAIERMNGIKLGNRQIKVGRPSNMPQATSILEEIDSDCENGSTIYIANIRPEFDQVDLMCLMEPFGDIEKSKFYIDESQRKSFAYVQFKDRADANEALTADKLDLAGYTLNVCKAITQLVPINTKSNSSSNSAVENRTTSKDDINSGENSDNEPSNNNTNINNNNNRSNNYNDSRIMGRTESSTEVAMDCGAGASGDHKPAITTGNEHYKPKSSLPSAYANIVSDD